MKLQSSNKTWIMAVHKDFIVLKVVLVWFSFLGQWGINFWPCQYRKEYYYYLVSKQPYLSTWNPINPCSILVGVFDRKPQASLKLLHQAEIRKAKSYNYCKSSDQQRCAAKSNLYCIYLTWTTQGSQPWCGQSFQELTDAVKCQKPYSLWCQASSTTGTIKNSSKLLWTWLVKLAINTKLK